MPPSLTQESACSHSKIIYTPSPHATQIGHAQPTLKQRQDAMHAAAPLSKSRLRLRPDQLITDVDIFPAPLVLPGDDLALDPEYPPQSFREWVDEEERNAVTARRRTVYVVSPPGVDSGMDGLGVEGWACPRDIDSALMAPFPETSDVVDYLSAFYHGLPVKHLDIPNWKFTSWDDPETQSTKRASKGKSKTSQLKKAQPQSIGLATSTECIRIRTRPCPDSVYSQQLNLDDLLDAAISILPKDAYALCMLVHHDLFEDEDDTFVCGRAYGGSRVAVVSTARYNPVLDAVQGVQRDHSWPAAHCAAYIEDMCHAAGPASKRKKGNSKIQPQSSQQHDKDGNQPLEAALAAYKGPRSSSNNSTSTIVPQSTTALWLWRIARTVSHELGHCFGIDHCVYYACIMQGSASLSEDTRQPPYLCPVDLAKVLAATGASVEERDRALLRFCEREEWRGEPSFRAYAAWLKCSLRLGSSSDGDRKEKKECKQAGYRTPTVY
ncbi:hypothetical protein BJX64DRAFT_276435 [Aspergillus heterothallicus]